MGVYEALLWNLRSRPVKRLCSYCLIGFILVLIIRYLTTTQPDMEIIAADTGDRAYRRVATHSKWIVVTTINRPTKSLVALSQVTDWKMVVVGDRLTPRDWFIPGVVFLDVATQKALGYRTTPLLPYDSYTRKTVGYLYAIEHGARYIYETDDDNVLLGDLHGFHIDTVVTHGLMPATNNLTFNPYPHFGQSSLWPRGFPLEDVGHKVTYDYRFCSIHSPSIRQAVANGDPDVDAVFRLTRRFESDKGSLIFDPVAPPIVIPRGTFVPFNSQNTLYASGAFWALVLPTTVSDRSCDIYRSYWAQALLWLVGGHLGFYPPNVKHVRNKHSSLSDLAEETEMYQHTGRLLRFLHTWKCDRLFLFDCMTKLAGDMALNKFLQRRDVDVVNAWVADLATLGYAPPAIRHSSTCLDGLRVQYFPHEQNTSFAHVDGLSNVKADLAHKDARSELVQRECSAEIDNTVGDDDETVLTTQNILLVVTFHNPATTLPLIHAYYKHCYTHILYCGASTPDKTLLHKWKMSYLTMSNAAGAISCVKAASEMGYNVDGFLHVSDKMLLHSGNKLHAHGTSQILITENTLQLSQLCKENAADCLVLTTRVIKDLSEKVNTLDTGHRIKLKLKECFKKFVPSGANEASFVEGTTFYVPQRHLKLFRALAEVYTGRYSQVPLLLLGCLESRPLYFTSARQQTADHRVDFIFPFSFSAIDTNTAARSQYCKSLRSC